ncbi:ABC transporter permease subunit [Pseudooceanicola sp. GBMRC 2024]|uniref:ABC transporter permease subunit n=1 Tax=Pseudooceanicola albus TaxID=2692189 RepID=A0A6L7G690_9RHOB|nr:ABC transporter permease subunit [Pseudooceanicola albus]
MATLSFLTRRLSQGALIVFLAALIVFTLLRIGPGDPARMLAGGLSDQASVDALSKQMGLDDPFIVQFGKYIGGIVTHGDFGHSYIRSENGQSVGGGHGDSAGASNRASVISLILGRLPLSLALAAAGLGLALVISAPIGIWAGLRAGKWPDSVTIMGSSILVSMPSFWIAGLLVLLVSIKLQWLPAVGYSGPKYLILPAIVLAIEMAPIFIRTWSSAISSMTRRDFIRVAPVRGLGSKAVFTRHVLRGAAVPFINTLGVMLTSLIGSLLVIEYVFDFPGLGKLTVEAVMQRDFPLVQAIAIVISTFFVLVNIAVDYVSGLFDPRLDY